MRLLTLFDTSVCSQNIGDQIIVDSITNVINELFSELFLVRVPTHDVISRETYKTLTHSQYKIIGGSNLLSSNMNRYNQWKINLWDSFFVNGAILCGVGWWQYQNNPNPYTKFLLKKVLSKDFVHSVRDDYTKHKLDSIGITNVVTTGCPTLWGLTSDHCLEIPKVKSKNVVLTLTDYRKDPSADLELISILKAEYSQLYFWPQGTNDLEYLRTLAPSGINIIQPSLKSYDSLLSSDYDLDFIGTRLHAGIRAMQFKRRSIIIGVDNRATEMAKDFSLPVVDRTQLCKLREIVRNEFETDIKLPIEMINIWKSQFKKNT